MNIHIQLHGLPLLLSVLAMGEQQQSRAAGCSLHQARSSPGGIDEGTSFSKTSLARYYFLK